MTNLEALDRYADVLRLTSNERILFYMVSSGFKVKDSAEAVYMSPSQGSRVYHNVRRNLETAIRVEEWVLSKIVLSPGDSAKLLEVLDNPPEPNTALRALMGDK